MPHRCALILAHNLKTRRVALGETQKDFARKAGISYRLYQRLESGSANPTIDSLGAIAKRLNVATVDLLALRCIRVPAPVLNYIELLKSRFENSRFAVGIRDLDGVVIWANKASIKLHSLEGKSFPIHVAHFVSQESAEGYKRQLISEKLGMAHPYTNALLRPDGSFFYLRYFPVLIYANQDSNPSFTIAHSVDIHSSSEADHLDFYNGMIDCYDQTKGKAPKKSSARKPTGTRIIE